MVDDEGESYNEDEQCYIEVDKDELQQVDQIRAKIKLPIISKEPINEYELDGILTLAFPKVFPLGLADPTRKKWLKPVNETEGCKHLLKYACKDSKGELYYPFAEHPRALFYVYDRLRRHRAMVNAKFIWNKIRVMPL